MIQGEIPKRESVLWEDLSNSSGMQCPTYSHCEHRLGGTWCPSDNLDCTAKLLDDQRFVASKYDFVGSLGGCGEIFRLVERLAQNYLKRAKVYCPPIPEEIIYLADEHHPIEVRLVPFKIYHGAIWRLRDSWVIQLNENDASVRKRFALFHEAFHVLARCRATTLVFRKRGRNAGSFSEFLADYFARCVLIPRKWVEKKWPETRDLDQIAKIFDVPKPLMWLRLREMGLL